MPQQLYDLNSAYGSQEQLHALLEGLKAAGVAPIADVVINHRLANKQRRRRFRQAGGELLRMFAGECIVLFVCVWQQAAGSARIQTAGRDWSAAGCRLLLWLSAV
jgi:hypothetical protein